MALEKILGQGRSAFLSQNNDRDNVLLCGKTGTVYTDGNQLLPRDYVLKLQACGVGWGTKEVRKTVAKTRIDFAKYCDPEKPNLQDTLGMRTFRPGTYRPQPEEVIFMK